MMAYEVIYHPRQDEPGLRWDADALQARDTHAADLNERLVTRQLAERAARLLAAEQGARWATVTAAGYRAAKGEG